jgi:hypothetical protein
MGTLPVSSGKTFNVLIFGANGLIGHLDDPSQQQYSG